MYRADYLDSMPTAQLSIIKLLAVFNNIYISKLQKQARMPYGCFKQLLVLNVELTARRKSAIGLNAWYNSTHTGNASIKTRRENFSKNNTLLLSLGYVIIYDVARGKSAEITPTGLLFLEQINSFLEEYISNFYSKFNLKQ